MTSKTTSDHFHPDPSDPRRTTDSAGLVVFRGDPAASEVLMIIMRKTRYSFPKGHLEPGETVEACALRETWEETGVRASVVPGFLYSVPSMYPGDKRSIHFLVGTVDPDEPGELRPQLHEVDDALWVNAREAVDLVTFPADRQMCQEALDFWLNR